LEDAQGNQPIEDLDEAQPRPEFTSGSLSGQVVKLAIPSMLAMMFHSAYSTIDMIWLGRLSKEAIAAVTIYWMFYMLLALFNQMVALGSFSLMARSYGAKDYEQTSDIIGQTITFKMFFAVPAAVLGYFFVYDAFVMYGALPEVAILGSIYARILLVGLPLYFAGWTLNTGFRSIGDVKKPMILAAISMGMNIVLDPIFIFTFGWGVAGAAFASLISQVTFFVIGLNVFFTGKTYVNLSLKHLIKPRLYWIKKFVVIGLPAVVGDACRFSAHFVMGWVVLAFGTATMAAFGVGARIADLAFIPLFGLHTAISTLVGQNLGAEKPDRAEQTTLWGTFATLGIMSVLAGIAFALAPQLIMVFNSEPEVVLVGSRLLRFGSFIIMFVSVTSGLGSAFWGSGDTVPLAIVQAIALWGVQMPLVFFFVKYHDTSVTFVWLSILIAEFIGCLMMIFLFSRGGWKRKKV
jgi:putative MATE family efflux protein